MLDTHETASGSILDLRAKPEFQPFLGRVQSLLADPLASLDDMIGLVYGPENPVTDKTVIPGRGYVTRSVLESPAYQAMADMVWRKQREALRRA